MDHVFDSLDPYLDSGTSFKRYTYKKKLHGNTGRKNTQEIKRTRSTSVKREKQHTGRYVQNKNKKVELSRSIDENKKQNVQLKINKQYNVYDHIYHKNQLRRASSMPAYTSRPQIVHRKTLAIEGPRVKGISRSAKDLRSRSSERSLARRGLKRSGSEGANVDKNGEINRKHTQISRKVKEQPRRAYSHSPRRAVRRRHHSHDEIVHRRNQRNLESSRPSATKSVRGIPSSVKYVSGPQSVRSARDGPSRERSQKHLYMEDERSLKNRNKPQNSSRNRSRNYSASNPVTNVNLKSSLKNKNFESEMIHRDSRFHAERGSDLRHSTNMQQYSESSESSQEEEEYEEEYEENCEERSEERSASWYDRMESIRIRREIREEYFRMMEELFILSGDGIHSENFCFFFRCMTKGGELKKNYTVVHSIKINFYGHCIKPCGSSECQPVLENFQKRPISLPKTWSKAGWGEQVHVLWAL